MARYREIMDSLVETIAREGLRSGDKLAVDRELAAAFGVSVKTVKHALRELEHQGVVVRRNGVGTFVGAGAARGKLVVFLHSAAGQGYGSEILREVEQACFAEKRSLLYLATGNCSATAQAQWAGLEGVAVDGVLFHPFTGEEARHNAAFLGLLRKACQQVIVLDHKLGIEGLSFVGNENVGASFALTERLLRHDYDRYFFIADEAAPAVEERYAGFCSALRSYGVVPGRAVAERLAEADVEPAVGVHLAAGARLGLFFVNDGSAARRLPWLLARGVSLPDEVGAVGFGGLPFVKPFGLTTAAMDFKRLGRGIVNILRRRGPQTLVVPTKLVKGRTA